MSGSWHYQLATAPPRTEAAAMAAYARELGVPSTALLEETRSMDTLGNAYFTKVDVCRPHGWCHLLIVASDEHMERVRSIFTKVFGRGYALQFVESDRVLDVDAHRRAQANEALLVRDLMPRLDQIHDGDDVAIRDLLLQTIPAYRHRPHISAGEPLVISTSGCDSGAMTARYTVTPTDGGTPVEGDLLPQADGSITITTAIATVGVAPGQATVALIVTCGALPARAVAFDLYIDPSGAVLDQDGQPVAGATVRLLRADSAAGPFTEIASDATARDAHLDPGTPNAPETTGSDGAYSWNVTQGYYRVEAFAAGYACPTPAPIGFACVVDGDGRSGIASAPLAIPPAVVGLTLHLTRQDTACTGAPCPGDPAATPELGSGDLLAIGLLPFGVALYRRRRTRRATQQ